VLCFSVVTFATVVPTLYPLVVRPERFLGLIPELPTLFWVGLSAVLFCFAIVAMLDTTGDALNVAVLFVLVVYLFGVPIVAQPNARWPYAYYPSGEAKAVMKQGHLDIFSPRSHPMSYHDWPAVHFLSAVLVETSCVSLAVLIHLFPLYWALTFSLWAYAIGRKTRLSRGMCLLLSTLVVSSYWGNQYYYGPQALAMLFMAMTFFLVQVLPAGKERIVTLGATWAALVTTHMLTSLSTLLGVALASLRDSARTRRFTILLAVIFASWLVYVCSDIVHLGTLKLWEQFATWDFFTFRKDAQFATPAISVSRRIARTIRLSYPVFYVVGILFALLDYTRRGWGDSTKKYARAGLLWLAGIWLLLPLYYGTEMAFRVYLYSIVPGGLVIALWVARRGLKSIAIAFVVMMALLHMPADYSADANVQTRDQELVGARFCAWHMSRTKRIYNIFALPYLAYYRPELIGIAAYSRRSSKIELPVLNEVDYVLSTEQFTNFQVYTFGSDAVQIWTATKRGFESSLVYDNCYYKMYANDVGNIE